MRGLGRSPRCPHCMSFMRRNSGRVKVGQHTPVWICRRKACRYPQSPRAREAGR